MQLETRNKAFKLDQETLIPLGIVASLFVTMIGLVAWLTNLANATTQNSVAIAGQESEIRELRQSQDNWNHLLVDVQLKLEKISGQLSELAKKH